MPTQTWSAMWTVPAAGVRTRLTTKGIGGASKNRTYDLSIISAAL